MTRRLQKNLRFDTALPTVVAPKAIAGGIVGIFPTFESKRRRPISFNSVRTARDWICPHRVPYVYITHRPQVCLHPPIGRPAGAIVP